MSDFGKRMPRRSGAQVKVYSARRFFFFSSVFVNFLGFLPDITNLPLNIGSSFPANLDIPFTVSFLHRPCNWRRENAQGHGEQVLSL
jgi:hypothetical protein